MDIKTLHSNCMKQLRTFLKKDIRITFQNGEKKIVPCTISDIKADMLKYSEYVGKDSKIFNVLISDLIKVQAPITGFMYVEVDRVKYQVQEVSRNGNFDNTLSLACVIYRVGING